jgi:hypothetical protein
VYSDFSIEKVKKDFGLTEKRAVLFDSPESIEPDKWLTDTLNLSLKFALSSSSEKARSEFIVAPVLLETVRRNNEEFSIFSGERLDVDEEKGLKGECDFILSKGAVSTTIQSPIFLLVEAKKNDIKDGLGQCIAQMLGAKIFNDRENSGIDAVCGCVTTGEVWQFLKLEDNIVFIDTVRYYINEIGKLIGVFQKIVDYYKIQ